MDLASLLIRKITFPFWMIWDGNVALLRYLRRFDRLEHESRDALLVRQRDNLRALLHHAHAHSTYYHEVFNQAGLIPERADLPGDLLRLPLLTKDIVRSRNADIIASNVARDDMFEASTGGSTGIPMSFLRDRHCLYLRRAQELHFDHWMGYEIGHKVATFVAASHYDKPGDRWKEAIRNTTCERMLRFDPHHITDRYMDAFAARFVAYRPTMIKCFPNSLAIFADFVNRRGLRLPPVRAISCTGENLYPHQRQLFADTFGGEVFEKYGTKETGVMACECSMHRGLHTFTEGSYVEILGADGKPAQAGEMGRLVVTDLFNYGMPMIRYEIGDMAVVAARDACGCGSPLPLIDRIVGRDRDILYDGDGNPKPGYLFVETVNALGLTAQFQIIQTARDSVLMKVIPNGAEAGDIETARLRIAGILGPRVHVRTELTNQLPRDPSGKYRYVVSQLRPSEQPPSQPAQLQLP